MNEKSLVKKENLLWFAPIIFLIIALLPLPYGYYQIMRWIICGCAIGIAYTRFQNKGWDYVTIIFALIAAVYNPITTIHLEKEIWMVVNLSLIHI